MKTGKNQVVISQNQTKQKKYKRKAGNEKSIYVLRKKRQELQVIVSSYLLIRKE